MKLILIILFILTSNLLNARVIEFSLKSKISFQEIINNAGICDTIVVQKGEYFINSIKIEKNLKVFGHGYPIFNANNKQGDLIYVHADSVIISGIIIKNVPKAHTSDNAAIKIKKSRKVIIENIKTENCFFGIYLSGSDSCNLINNSITGNRKNETSSGNGIHLWKCNDINIIGNKVNFHRDGIYFEFVKNTHITNNISTHNVRYGLHYMFSDSCSYQSNQFLNNGAGVAVMYTKNVLMKNNIFRDNWGSASYGILLKDIRDSKIVNNQFINNTIGILAEGSNRIEMKNNNFIQNGWGLKIMGNCVDNSINTNNFIGNSFDVGTNSMESFNNFDGNYWSKYKGYDLNDNKTGDVPYYPVSLFSMVVQSSGPALLLMNSIFIDILEIGEKVFPSVIPKKVIDNKPIMRKIDVKFE